MTLDNVLAAAAAAVDAVRVVVVAVAEGAVSVVCSNVY